MARPRTLLTKWIKRFRLTDWNIRLRVVPFASLNTGSDGGSVKFGEAEWDPYERQAVITIADPATVPEDAPDLEELIVHELLHIVVNGHQLTNDDINFERVVRTLVPCLVRRGR